MFILTELATNQVISVVKALVQEATTAVAVVVLPRGRKFIPSPKFCVCVCVEKKTLLDPSCRRPWTCCTRSWLLTYATAFAAFDWCLCLMLGGSMATTSSVWIWHFIYSFCCLSCVLLHMFGFLGFVAFYLPSYSTFVDRYKTSKKKLQIGKPVSRVWAWAQSTVPKGNNTNCANYPSGPSKV